MRKLLHFERVQRIYFWYNEGQAKVILGWTTVGISASALFFALIALYYAVSLPKPFKDLRRAFEALEEEFEDQRDHIRVALGRMSRLKRTTMEASDDVQPTGSMSPAPDEGSVGFPLTARQAVINQQILKRRAKV